VHWVLSTHAEEAPPSPLATVGLHTVLSQVNPAPHAALAQLVRHWPSAQTLESPHSLEYLHVSWVGVQAPATHARPAPQSLGPAQGHGPALPPHAWQLPAAVHVLPLPQSDLLEHCFAGPASAGGAPPSGTGERRVPGLVPGGEQSPVWHVSPFGHEASEAQGIAQPVVVQTVPELQLESDAHVGWAGAETFEHP
jgi:hypothetical protein